MKTGHTLIINLFLGLIMIGCTQNQSTEKQKISEHQLFQKLDSSSTNIQFHNKITNQDKFNIFTYRNFYNGGGVGIIDVNNDGLQDIYLTGNQVQNKLYLNQGNLKFKDITETAGVAGQAVWSTGVSVVDINQDGFLDLYVSNAGYSDSQRPINELFINNGDLTFTEKAGEYGLAEDGYTTHTAFFDYDQDGDLDAYILNNSFVPVNTLNYSNKREQYAEDWPVRDFLKGGGDKLLRNDNGIFVDATKEAGIYGSLIGFGLGVTVGDVNQDMLLDIYISNDFFEHDYLYINQGDGTFSEESKKWMGHMSLASMGADIGDINNDGLFDIFTTEMIPETDAIIKQKLQFEDYNTYQLKLRKGFYHQYMHNALQLNSGENRFKEIAWHAGVAQSDWSWGALMFDADLDGWNDLFVCNGVYQDVTDADFMDFFANDVVQQMVLTGEKEKYQNILKKMPINPQANKLFLNQNGLAFKDGHASSGLNEKTFSNGAAYADLDNDGDLDLVVNNLNQFSAVYESKAKTAEKHHLQIHLKYEAPNLNAVGAVVKVYSGNKTQSKQIMPNRGFQSSVDYRLHFGLGKEASADSIQVAWPNLQVETYRNFTSDSLLTITYEANTAQSKKKLSKEEFALGKKTVALPLEDFTDFTHSENEYVDFYYEGLIMRMLSREGPAIEIADFNADGLDDIIVGGAQGQKSTLFYQTNLEFQAVDINDEAKESTAIHAADLNNDGLEDLYIGYGGNSYEKGSNKYQDKIYFQTKSGSFEEKADVLPSLLQNTAVIKSFDYDEDGDLDLFVGSRSSPREYGVTPKSYLLENEGGKRFTDVTVRRAKEIENIGMVTSAELADLNGDGITELVIAGEWMGIEVFEIKNKQLIRKAVSGLNDLQGWWNAIKLVDLNNDGLLEIIAGNMGDNMYLTHEDSTELKIWLHDFDRNGDLDKIISKTQTTGAIPVQQKGEMVSQLPLLKKRNLKYADYAKKSVSELFPEQSIIAEKKSASYFKSVILYQDENFEFSLRELPAQAQLSAIHAIELADINGDAYQDLILTGNEDHFKPQYGKLDANHGLVVLGNKAGTFNETNRTLDLGLVGNVRSISKINIKGVERLLFGINNSPIKMLKLERINQ